MARAGASELPNPKGSRRAGAVPTIRRPPLWITTQPAPRAAAVAAAVAAAPAQIRRPGRRAAAGTDSSVGGCSARTGAEGSTRARVGLAEWPGIGVGSGAAPRRRRAAGRWPGCRRVGAGASRRRGRMARRPGSALLGGGRGGRRGRSHRLVGVSTGIDGELAGRGRTAAGAGSETGRVATGSAGGSAAVGGVGGGSPGSWTVSFALDGSTGGPALRVAGSGASGRGRLRRAPEQRGLGEFAARRGGGAGSTVLGSPSGRSWERACGRPGRRWPRSSFVGGCSSFSSASSAFFLLVFSVGFSALLGSGLVAVGRRMHRQRDRLAAEPALVEEQGGDQDDEREHGSEPDSGLASSGPGMGTGRRARLRGMSGSFAWLWSARSSRPGSVGHHLVPLAPERREPDLGEPGQDEGRTLEPFRGGRGEAEVSLDSSSVIRRGVGHGRLRGLGVGLGVNPDGLGFRSGFGFGSVGGSASGLSGRESSRSFGLVVGPFGSGHRWATLSFALRARGFVASSSADGRDGLAGQDGQLGVFAERSA